MANNRRFVVNLEIDSSTAEKQIKTTAKNIKAILTDMGNASDKMTYFKELVDYISQIDSQLNAFKKKYGDDMFNKMFGGLDSSLQKQMESLFDTTTKELTAVEELRQKITSAQKSGATKEEAKALKAEVEALYAGLGRSGDIDISNRLGPANMLKESLLALDEFAIKWKDVNNQVSAGFGLGAGPGGGISDDIQKKINELNETKKSLQQVVDAISDEKGTKVEIPKKDKEQLALLEELVNKYKQAADARKAFETRKDAGSDAYKKAVVEEIIAAKQLKGAFDAGPDAEIFGDKSSTYMVSDGPSDAYAQAEKALKDFYNDQNNMLSKIKSLYSSAIQDINNEIEKLMAAPQDQSNAYDKLNAKLKQFISLQKEIDQLDTGSQEYRGLVDQRDVLQEEINLLSKLGDKADKVDDILFDLMESDKGAAAENTALNELSDILGIEIPAAAQKAESALNIGQTDQLDKISSEFKTITTEAGKTGEAVQKVMYHIGNLFSKQGKRDTFGDTLENLTTRVEGTEWEEYGFGVLGGGLFGVTDPSTIDHNPKATQFVQSIDLSKYNMYMADTEERATALMKFLSKLQKISIKNALPDYTGFDAHLKDVNIDTLYSEFQAVFSQSELTKNEFNEFVNEMSSLLKQAGINFDEQTNSLDFSSLGKLKNTDNISTRFLKKLGYQGVDVGTTLFDGFGQGSVLFDFKDEDIVGYFNTIESAVRDYQNIVQQIDGQEWVGTSQQLEEYKQNLNEIIDRVKAYHNAAEQKGVKESTLSKYDQTLAKLEQVRNNIDDVMSGKELSGTSLSDTNITGIQQAAAAHRDNADAIKEEADAKKKLSNINEPSSDLIDKNTVEQIEQAKNKLSEFYTVASDVQFEKDFMKLSDEELKDYRAHLESLNIELQELASQGLLTAQDIERANTIYKEATRNISTAFEKKLSSQRDLNDDYVISQNMQANRKLQEFYDLTEKTQDMSFNIPDQELGIYSGKLESVKNDLEELSMQGLLTANDMEKVAQAYDEANKKIQTALDNNEHRRQIQQQDYEGVTAEVGYLTSENDDLREKVDYWQDAFMNASELADTYKSELDAKKNIGTDGEITDNGIATEIQQLERLQEKVKAVTEVIELKTNAFQTEGDVVSQVVDKEVMALDTLSTYLDTICMSINNIIDGLNRINNTKLNDVVDDQTSAAVDAHDTNSPNVDKDNYALNSTLLTTNSILNQILTAVSGNESTKQISEALDGAIAELKAAASALKANADDFKQKAKDDAKNDSTDSKDEKDTSKDSKKEKTFDELKNNEADSFDKYRKDVEESIHITDEFKGRLDTLQAELANVGDVNGLDAWKQSFEGFRTEFSRFEDASKNVLTGQINSIKKEAKDALKGIDLENTTIDKKIDPEGYKKQRAEQEKIAQGFKEIQIASDICTSQVKSNQQAEIAALNKKKQKLLESVQAYKKEYGFLNSGGKSGKNYGSTAIIQETTRYNQFKQYRDDQGASFKDSDAFNSALAKYESAYTRLINLREKFASKPVLTDRDVQEFNDAKKAAANYGKELDKMIAKSNKLESSKFQSSKIGADIDVDNALSRKQALTDFVTNMHDAREATIRFSNDYQECMFKMKNSDGTWTKMTATLDKTSNKMYSTAGEITKHGTAVGEFVGALKGEFLKLGRYMIASFGIEEVIQAVRTGVTYVKEIDDALTDLKKVTNETDAGYDRFLQTMSKTAGVVGSTVAELTTMAAEWSRLGYSMQEAADLAESTAILLNVSEFEDATQASEALISTIQAFGYAADDSMHVVDILNEVGKFIAQVV